jgi:enterobactin synthetase component D / holo-[acyl-carrier protein] synthase
VTAGLRRADRLALAHGACVIVELDDEAGALARLPPAEQDRVAQLGPVRRREFIAGRTALHLALGSDAAILSDDRGAPCLPPGWVGSVSHKRALAAALVAPAGEGRLGVDLELAAPPRGDIGRRVLTAREQAELTDGGRGVTLRFAIKEAIYKAIDPYVRRYVGFTEVELALAGDAVTVTTALPFAIEATWREHAGHWLTTAYAVPR